MTRLEALLAYIDAEVTGVDRTGLGALCTIAQKLKDDSGADISSFLAVLEEESDV